MRAPAQALGSAPLKLPRQAADWQGVVLTLSLGGLAIALAALSELRESHCVRIPLLTRGGAVVEAVIARRIGFAATLLVVVAVAMLVR